MKKEIFIVVTVISLAYFASKLFAQAVGTVVVSTSITATAGASTDANQIICTGTPGIVNSISTMHLVCSSGGSNILTADAIVAAGTGVITSVAKGSNNITTQLSKGTPDGWQVAANGTVKTGTF